jgi:hypothetical protein
MNSHTETEHVRQARGKGVYQSVHQVLTGTQCGRLLELNYSALEEENTVSITKIVLKVTNVNGH